MRLPFVGGAYESSSLPISAQESINCYVEIGPQATNPLVLKGVPGTTLFSDLTGPVRGMATAFQKLYVVAGNTAYRVASNGVATSLGNVINDGKPVTIIHNIFEVLIISGGAGYVCQEGATSLTQITDAEWPDTKIGAFIDGYGLLVEKDSGRFWWTAISDFESITGTDFATAEGTPDDLVSILVDHREIWLFGEETTEIWYNSGSVPFVRAPGGFVERGCGATWSPAKVDNTVYWLGEDGIVYKAEDRTPMRVSNHGIEKIIRDSTMSEAVGYSYTEEGHAFYALNFPGEATIVYDAATQTWHTRKTEGRNDCVYHCSARAYGKQYVGGVDGKLYQLDPDVYTHNGEPLVRTRAIGPIRTDGFASMSHLTLLMETGGGSYTADAELQLRISDDAGGTFSGPIYASMGRLGQRTFEVRYNALGGFYDNERVLKISLSEDAPFVVVAADV